ncbi:MAG: Methionine biosynthesis protein MetW-like protein [Parcubacteria group bacterium GW2011_GWD2_38_12]|nr:MAG: Methionine biosynthesis protein MetW-like protein [Parcubacteria group bacterium GW2011_GWC2_36_17]KKQ43030.1 MAG: Methionine biosynthesis protein MetW-like protein [Parcubacteria group bacterium GW2011_GWE2_37_8]KKQ52465.1 MAG: Methionine biosynthesis protein MetW-like protein [Parcubacteria group bacterium GW2011_GWD2_38_12]KKQ58359.1 MAG: Methionine biosynthesis protein MetW-like protein [Parcubacteria group bacterium GW2011_GWC1_38_17]KKQ59492.1 MAG: Methionine biosynthesis protein 
MNCPNCNSQKNKIRFSLDTYKIVKCLNCGVFYNRDFPEKEDLKETFSEKYYSDIQKEAFSYIKEQRNEDVSWDIYRLGLDYIEKNSGKGYLLDVGCAFGSFLKFASNRGWRVGGVEISEYSSSYARDVRGFNVLTGNLLNLPAQNEQFDVVTFWDSIEHMREVRQNIEKASAILKPKGYIVITTDNFNGFLSFVASLFYYASFTFLKYPIRKFFIPYNSCYLTHSKLKTILSQVGLKEVYYRGIDYPLSKIKLNFFERVILGILYKIGDLLNMNSQFIIIAQK